MAREKHPAEADDFGTPAYSVLDDAGFGFTQELLDSAADRPDAPTEKSSAPRERRRKSPESKRERWMGVQQGNRQTGTCVASGQGDAEAGMPLPDADDESRH